VNALSSYASGSLGEYRRQVSRLEIGGRRGRVQELPALAAEESPGTRVRVRAAPLSRPLLDYARRRSHTEDPHEWNDRAAHAHHHSLGARASMRRRPCTGPPHTAGVLSIA
jgi:hypothetical protein